MNIKKTNSDNIIGTSYHDDYLYTTPNTLKEIFGDWEEGDGYKTFYEWYLILNDEIPFTLYDWKQGHCSPDTILEFHIGTKYSKDSIIVKNELNNILESANNSK